MRMIAALAVILIGNCLNPSLKAGDVIKDKSPDGKFALRITKEDQGWGAANTRFQRFARTMVERGRANACHF